MKKGLFKLMFCDNCQDAYSTLENATVIVPNEWMKDIVEQCDKAELERDGITDAIFDFVEENNLHSKFCEFLKKYKEKYPFDVEFMMLDYQ